MTPVKMTLALGIALVNVGIYRFGLIDLLLENHPGFLGMTIFTALMFAPAIFAFHWRAATERRRGVGTLALAAALAFACVTAATRDGIGLLGYSLLALLLGIMEALLIPALQAWFSRESAGGLAAGNSALWGISCISLIASPIIFSHLRHISNTAVGLVGMGMLALLIRQLSSQSTAAASSEASQPRPCESARTTLAVLFLAGAAIGAISNMIYPITLRLLRLDGWHVGLYACLPMLSASLGARLQNALGGDYERWFLAAFIGIPAAFLMSTPWMIPIILFAWGFCFGYVETQWLSKHAAFNDALSAKYCGLASGIVLSGLFAEVGISPVAALGLGFYGTFAVGGVYGWRINRRVNFGTAKGCGHAGELLSPR
ncbi:MAG: hypothetical protein A2X37_06210 [Elusimicrobia bacterium GWA2_66_18]|nr:MAG: hypothetical protein A2X37_06210 [Elusimicrobia bacterium GWA2_66_18]